jgi:hypothetical protein
MRIMRLEQKVQELRKITESASIQDKLRDMVHTKLLGGGGSVSSSRPASSKPRGKRRKRVDSAGSSVEDSSAIDEGSSTLAASPSRFTRDGGSVVEDSRVIPPEARPPRPRAGDRRTPAEDFDDRRGMHAPSALDLLSQNSSTDQLGFDVAGIASMSRKHSQAPSLPASANSASQSPTKSDRAKSGHAALELRPGARRPKAVSTLSVAPSPSPFAGLDSNSMVLPEGSSVFTNDLSTAIRAGSVVSQSGFPSRQSHGADPASTAQEEAGQRGAGRRTHGGVTYGDSSEDEDSGSDRYQTKQPSRPSSSRVARDQISSRNSKRITYEDEDMRSDEGSQSDADITSRHSRRPGTGQASSHPPSAADSRHQNNAIDVRNVTPTKSLRVKSADRSPEVASGRQAASKMPSPYAVDLAAQLSGSAKKKKPSASAVTSRRPRGEGAGGGSDRASGSNAADAAERSRAAVSPPRRPEDSPENSRSESSALASRGGSSSHQPAGSLSPSRSARRQSLESYLSPGRRAASGDLASGLMDSARREPAGLSSSPDLRPSSSSRRAGTESTRSADLDGAWAGKDERLLRSSLRGSKTANDLYLSDSDSVVSYDPQGRVLSTDPEDIPQNFAARSTDRSVDYRRLDSHRDAEDTGSHRATAVPDYSYISKYKLSSQQTSSASRADAYSSSTTNPERRCGMLVYSFFFFFSLF